MSEYLDLHDAINAALITELATVDAARVTETVMTALDTYAFTSERFLAHQVEFLRDQLETASNRDMARGFEIAALRAEIKPRLDRTTCDACGADVPLTKTGRVRTHRRADGFGRCANSGQEATA